MSYDKIIKNAIILSKNYDYKAFVGSIAIQDGIIVEITEGEFNDIKDAEVIDATDKIAIPGLFNCHCHGDMTLARGLGDGLTLFEQNELYSSHNWFYDFINDDDRYYSRQLTYLEALKSGTTFMVENMYWGLGTRSVEAMKEIGIKGGLVEDIRLDFGDSDVFRTNEELLEFKHAAEKEGYIPIIGSLAEEDYETARLQNIEKIVTDLGFYKTMHLAENTWRQEIVKEKFGTTSVDYLAGIGVLNAKSLGSHVDWVNDDEIALMKKYDMQVVNTPTCEVKIEDGIAPISKMVNAGVNVALGTDGALWNNKNDIFREMRNMSLYQTWTEGRKSLSLESIFDMATINGAKVFNLDNEYGTLEVGKKASIVLVDSLQSHMRPLRLGVKDNVLSLIIYNASGQDVTDVFVDGKQLVKNKEVLSIDEYKIIKKVDETSAKIATCLEEQGL